MARFQTVERPSETVTKLIQNSVAKLKNKEGRVKGRRSKGVPQGLLHQVLVKGVIKDLVKVVNKETRFPKEISTKNTNGAAAAKGAAPRLTSPKKSPKPKSWLSSSPTSNKRNLLKQELQTTSPSSSENDASAANSSATATTPTKDTSPSGRSRLRNASPRRATVSQLSPANRRLNRSPSQPVNRSPIRTPSLKSSRVPLSPVSATINSSQNITSSASRTSLSSSSNALSSSCPKFSRVASKAALIRRRVQKAEGAAGRGAVKRTAKRTRVAAAGMQRGLTGNRVVGTVKRLKRR